MRKNSTIGEHLVSRLNEIGIDHMFGVPGDYNLAFLDYVIAHPTLRWVGAANELNAAYAADGYARCKGAAALLTTFGVGELSALNGIAGSYAEHLPVLHIVGAPSTAAQRDRLKMHHSFADGDFSHFSRMSAEITVATAELTVENAVEEIDRVLRTMLHQRRPGYIALPTDVARAPLRIAPEPFRRQEARCDRTQLEAFTRHAVQHLRAARKTTVLVDFLTDRWGCGERLERLIRLGGFESATMMMGKSAIDETLPGFIGAYAGAASSAYVREAVESADALITVGTLIFDIGTAGFSHTINPERVIDIQPFSASIGGVHYPDVPIEQALDSLTEAIQLLSWPSATFPAAVEIGSNWAASDESLTQNNFWPIIQDFLRAEDIVVAEQGTSFYGAAPLALPRNVKFIGQPLWASIGYTIPATYGAQLAIPGRRTVLLVGDGSALLTAQEIGSMLRDGTKPIILILNNNGYTVERAIHGPNERYNDIASWNWQQVAGAMGSSEASHTVRAETVGALRSALSNASDADRLILIEVMLPELDVPPLLGAITQAIAAKNAGR